MPDDLSGWRALDVGCNAGYYSFELARRGAQVTAVDFDARYLRQARWAAAQLGLCHNVAFRRLHVYELAREPTRYDLVWFMGVAYHLRHPLLALDPLRRLTRRLLVFQSMTFRPQMRARCRPTSVSTSAAGSRRRTGRNWHSSK